MWGGGQPSGCFAESVRHGRNVIGKIFAIIFPISAFVAAGFEHCVANMYFIPLGIVLADFFPEATPQAVNWVGLVRNLVPVTLGNLIGGSVFVGLVYWIIYRRDHRAES